MKQLSDRLYLLISRGTKAVGSFNPDEILFMFEEELYPDEVEPVIKFLRWVHADTANRAFGHGNYKQRYKEFLKSPDNK